MKIKAKKFCMNTYSKMEINEFYKSSWELIIEF